MKDKTAVNVTISSYHPYMIKNVQSWHSSLVVVCEEVQVGNDQEMVQSERNSLSISRAVGKN